MQIPKVYYIYEHIIIIKSTKKIIYALKPYTYFIFDTILDPPPPHGNYPFGVHGPVARPPMV